ncbi:MAG: hypothetical protein GX115_18060 [Ruminiclostridium sp.]|nr:hypothetical protein [Ruminiclostridium sp.]
MQKVNEQVFQKADALLGGNTLCNEAKAVLLLKMCHAALLFCPEKANQYWEPLRKLQYSIPADYTTEFNEIKTVKEDSETTKEPGGFIAEIQELLKKSNEKLLTNHTFLFF